MKTILNQTIVKDTVLFLEELSVTLMEESLEGMRERIKEFIEKYKITDNKDIISMYRGLANFRQENLFENVLENSRLYEFKNSLAEIFKIELQTLIMIAHEKLK